MRLRRRRRPPELGEGGPLATEADVVACYRLLLGRPPDPEGFEAQRVHVGRSTVDELVRSFLESEEFQSRGLSADLTRYDADLRLFELPLFRLYAWTGDADIGRAFVDGVYEPHVTRAMCVAVEPGMTVVDLGANIGYYAMLAAALVGPAGRVVAFEAGRANADLVLASAAANGFDHVEVHHAAVADRPGVLERHRARGSNGYVRPSQPGRPPPASGDVELTRAVVLDDALESLDRLDVVKIDIEGAEFQAMAGAPRTIERFRPVVLTEFSPEALRNISGVSGEAYLDLFLRRGYSISVVEHDEDRPVGTDPAALGALLAAGDRTHLDLRLDP